MNLFDEQAKESRTRSTPLADRIRPQTLADFVGQQHLVGEGRILRRAIENDDLVSMIFWGPPGVGKTTLAKIIARETQSDFFAMSAVTSGVADLRKVIGKAEANRELAKRTILFIDEIHRFNKAQQDALLHSVEDGTVLLIGATTENPSFEVIGPLLSRCRVYRLHALTFEEIEGIVKHALRKDEILSKQSVRLEEGADKLLVNLAGGDARIALNALELTVRLSEPDKDGALTIDQALVQEALQTKTQLYDKQGEYHYDVISAFIKSVRGSDPNGALYWLARMRSPGARSGHVCVHRGYVHRDAGGESGAGAGDYLSCLGAKKQCFIQSHFGSAPKYPGWPDGTRAAASAQCPHQTHERRRVCQRLFLSPRL